jgi:hypothetical protein
MTKSPDEIKKEYVNSLGDDFGSMLFFLHNKLINLNYVFEECEILFHEKNSNVEILNEYIPAMAMTFQNLIWNHILLEIAKFLDPAKTNKKNNATLNKLIEFVDNEILKEMCERILADIRSESNFAIQLRNKKLAHYDLDISLRTAPSPTSSFAQIRWVIEKFNELFNILNKNFLEMNFHYSSPNINGGATSLINCLTKLHEIEKH